MLSARVPSSGARNLVVHVSGMLEADTTTLVLLADLSSFDGKGLKLDKVQFLIQEKAGIILWWDGSEILLPLESRGQFSFDYPFMSPKDWDKKLYYTAFKVDEPKAIFISMDFDKKL